MGHTQNRGSKWIQVNYLNGEISLLPAADVVGVDVSASTSVSSSNRACSGVGAERIGGGGARRLFERLFRRMSGPIPVPIKKPKEIEFILFSYRKLIDTNGGFAQI